MLPLATMTRTYFHEHEAWLRSNAAFNGLLWRVHTKRVRYGTRFRAALEAAFPHDNVRRVQVEANVQAFARLLYGAEAEEWVKCVPNLTHFTALAVQDYPTLNHQHGGRQPWAGTFCRMLSEGVLEEPATCAEASEEQPKKRQRLK